MIFDFAFAWSILPKMLAGAVVTVQATLGGFVLAILVGALVTALRRAGPRWLSGSAYWCMEFLRSTPLLVKAYFLFFTLPDAGIVLAPFLTGVLALGLHHGAFASEAMRAGLAAVPRSQWEAGVALNFPSWRFYRHVVLPQAARPITPALSNMFISMLKDTPVLYAISVTEMMFVANEIGALEFQYTESITIAALVYLLVSLLGATAIRMLEKRLRLPGEHR